MFRNTLMASALVLIAGVASADTVFTVANTFEDPELTGGAEISTVAFDAGVYANQAATISDGVEIENFVGFYTIDVAADMSTLTMTVSDTAQPFNNPMPAGRFDRYYFTFTGATPTEATVDTDASTAAIAQGASVEMITTGRIVISFSEGADFTAGNTLVVNLK